jgi:hypothetical protein
VETIPCNTQACPVTYTSSVYIGSARDASFNFVCPSNSYITQINGRYGAWNDGIGVKCSDGTSSPYYGGPYGGPYATDCSSGFTGVNISANYQGPYIGIIQPKCNNINMPISGTNSGITDTKSLECPAGSVLGRMYGHAGNYLNQVGFQCVTKN